MEMLLEFFQHSWFPTLNLSLQLLLWFASCNNSLACEETITQLHYVF